MSGICRRRLFSTSDARISNSSPLASDDCLCCFRRTATREYGKSHEDESLVFLEELVAPVECVPKRPLARVAVARALPEQLESPVEAPENRRGGEHRAARGCKLDRERQPLEPRADRGDGSSAPFVENEHRSRSARPGGVERDGFVVEQFRYPVVGIREVERRHREDAFRGQP